MVCLLIACLFAEMATCCRRTRLYFVAFFAALDAAFRSVGPRGTFFRDVAILPTSEALRFLKEGTAGMLGAYFQWGILTWGTLLTF